MSSSKCSICGKHLSPTSGETGKTCLEHAGKLRQTAIVADKVPEGYIRMSKVCEAAVLEGLKISQVVTASGGDACTKPLLDEVFKVVYVGKAKYMHPDVLSKGFDLIRAKGSAKPAPQPQAEVMAIADELKAVVKG